jgi:hypothetical protein
LLIANECLKLVFKLQTVKKLPDIPMSHHDEINAQSQSEPNPADSRADAIAAFCAIAIAVTGVLYFISQQ